MLCIFPVTSRASRSWTRAGVPLLILGLTVYLPGLASIPPIDRDESRFAQASRQMLESGTLEGWIVPRIQDRPRLNKPPLIYWLQATSAFVLGDPDTLSTHQNILAYRLPSALCALATVLLVWRLGMRLVGPRASLLAGAMLAVCPLVAFDAHQARADQLLLTLTSASMLLLGTIYTDRARSRRVPIARAMLFWTCLAFSILAKGPITPMIAALAVLALCITTRRARWLGALRPAIGLPLLLLLTLPWLVAVASTVGWSSYLSTISDETIGRSATAKEGHWGPPGYHLVLLVPLFFPGSILTAIALTRSIKRALPSAPTRSARLTGAPPSATLFLLAWIIPAWLVFEFVSTKLPHYTMPLYPAIALLTARALLASFRSRAPDADKRSSRIGFAVWLVIAVVLLLAPWLVLLPWLHAIDTPPDRPMPALQTALILTASLAALAVVTFFLITARRLIRLGQPGLLPATLLAVLTLALSHAGLFQFLLPRANTASPRIAQAFYELDPEQHQQWGILNYHEDSLIFLTRGHLHRLNTGDIELWQARHPAGYIAQPSIDTDRQHGLPREGPTPLDVIDSSPNIMQGPIIGEIRIDRARYAPIPSGTP